MNREPVYDDLFDGGLCNGGFGLSLVCTKQVWTLHLS